MRRLLLTVPMVLVAAVAAATTLVLDPGPGYPTYLSHSCGGVQLNGGAVGFDAEGNVVTHQRAYTNCNGSGRGSRNRRYARLWEVVFRPTGEIVSRTPLSDEETWLQGSPAPADVTFDVDVDATYEFDGSVAGTTMVGAVYHAYIIPNGVLDAGGSPRQSRLALYTPRPNPAHGLLTFRLDLPDRAPARIEIFDVAGRRVLAEDLRGLGPGSHTVTVRGGRELPAGTYQARLTQGGNRATVRVAIVH